MGPYEFEPILVTFAGHTVSVHRVHKQLLSWGAIHGRQYPWRATTSSYAILMAEMMLRRTRANQVVPVYQRFIERFPCASALATGSADEIAAMLYPLGLAWRMPAFQLLARHLVQEHHGDVPADYHALTDLPGVGDYVASAVCCFAFNQPRLLADTNTVRVTGRLFGVMTHAESRRRKLVRDILQALLDPAHPRAYHYALLDLAALICTPSDPGCTRCPLLAHCKTGQERTACQSG